MYLYKESSWPAEVNILCHLLPFPWGGTETKEEEGRHAHPVHTFSILIGSLEYVGGTVGSGRVERVCSCLMELHSFPQKAPLFFF